MKKLGIFLLCILGFVIVFLLSGWITFNIMSGKDKDDSPIENTDTVYASDDQENVIPDDADEIEVENSVDFVPGSVTRITPGLHIEDAIITVGDSSDNVADNNAPADAVEEEEEALPVVVINDDEDDEAEVPETPKAVETPKVETPKVVETPKTAETPKVETPKAETPKAPETPKVEEPKAVETPKAEEAPKVEETPKVVETPKAPETPKVEEKPVLNPDIQTSDSGL